MWIDRDGRCKYRSTFSENNRWDFIRAVSLPRMKARKAKENVVTKNLNRRHNIVRG